jgi:ribosomal protein S18 acetylase RimI-like enzyme
MIDLSVKLSRTIRDGRIGETMRKAFGALIFSKEVQLLLVKDLEAGKLGFGSAERYETRLLTYPEDYALLHNAHRGRARRFRGWAEQGAMVLGGFHDGQLAAVHVLVTGKFKEPFCQNRFDLAPGDWLMLGGWVAREVRGSRIAAAMLTRTFELMREHDGKRAFVAVYEDNLASLKLMLHIGCDETGEMLIIWRLLGFCWASKTPYSGSRTKHLKRRRKG